MSFSFAQKANRENEERLKQAEVEERRQKAVQAQQGNRRSSAEMVNELKAATLRRMSAPDSNTGGKKRSSQAGLDHELAQLRKLAQEKRRSTKKKKKKSLRLRRSSQQAPSSIVVQLKALKASLPPDQPPRSYNKVRPGGRASRIRRRISVGKLQKIDNSCGETQAKSQKVEDSCGETQAVETTSSTNPSQPQPETTVLSSVLSPTTSTSVVQRRSPSPTPRRRKAHTIPLANAPTEVCLAPSESTEESTTPTHMYEDPKPPRAHSVSQSVGGIAGVYDAPVEKPTKRVGARATALSAVPLTRYVITPPAKEATAELYVDIDPGKSPEPDNIYCDEPTPSSLQPVYEDAEKPLTSPESPKATPRFDPTKAEPELTYEEVYAENISDTDVTYNEVLETTGSGDQLYSEAAPEESLGSPMHAAFPKPLSRVPSDRGGGGKLKEPAAVLVPKTANLCIYVAVDDPSSYGGEEDVFDGSSSTSDGLPHSPLTRSNSHQASNPVYNNGDDQLPMLPIRSGSMFHSQRPVAKPQKKETTPPIIPVHRSSLSVAPNPLVVGIPEKARSQSVGTDTSPVPATGASPVLPLKLPNPGPDAC